MLLSGFETLLNPNLKFNPNYTNYLPKYGLGVKNFKFEYSKNNNKHKSGRAQQTTTGGQPLVDGDGRWEWRVETVDRQWMDGASGRPFH
jgi:hypothetical protein